VSNVNGLLNLLSTSSPDATGLLGGNNPVAPKGPQNGNNSFQDVLARLASQSGNNNGSNSDSATPSGPITLGQAGQGTAPTPVIPGQAGTVTAVSETTLAVTESVKASNPQQLAQAEQTLASLAVGLAHLVTLMSQMNQGQSQQAQAALKALGAGPNALPGIQNILSNLQALFQQLPQNQNPLNLTSGQQTALLGQLFQQMIQNQQVLFGVTPAAQTGTSNAPQTGTGGNPQTAILQVLFSETQASLTQQGTTQASQVFINLQTFKMSATFIQQGQGSNLQALPPNSQALLNNLNLAMPNLQAANTPAVTPTNSISLASSQNDLNQNFKNLVQLLMQSGVGQAVLTTFMRNQQEAGNLTPANNQANAVLPVSANNPTQAPPANVEIPPVNPVELTTESANNANAAQVQQPVVNVLGTQNVNPLTTPTARNQVQNQPNAALRQALTGKNPPITENIVLNQNAGNIAARGNDATATGQNPPIQNPTNNNQVQPKTPVNPLLGETVALNPNEGAVQNNAVERLNVFASQVVTNVPNPTGQVPQGQNPVNNAQIQPQTPVQQPAPQNEGLIPSEVAALNDTVARLNASALHAIQGGIGGTATTPEINLTMGQVLSSLSADQLSSAVPPTFGNPSVPSTTPVTAQPIPPLNTAAPKTAGALAIVQPAQGTGGTTATPSNTTPQAVVFSGPAINVSNFLQEPINQAAPPTLQAVGNPPPANQAALNNTVGPLPPTGNINVNLASLPTVNTSNTAVTANPAPPVVTAPNAVVPLPQPATLPVGANPSAAQAAPPGVAPALAPALLNQAVNPPATSQAPTIPATAAVGEGVKAEIPATTVPRNENFANPSTVASAQPLSSVIPISPEAVAPAGSVLGTTTGLGILNVVDKNGPNSAVVLEANTLLGLSGAAYQPSDAHSTSPAAISTAPGMSFDTANLLNQISQQVAAQTTGASAVSRLNFQLIPESLGRVTVQIALVDQSVSARIVVTNPEVRETLQAHMVDLKSALNQAGLQIDQLQVQVQGGGGGSLLAQYYQYQQEGFGSRLPVSPVSNSAEGAQNPENIGDSGVVTSRMSLVDVLA
jgi:hypothetical protein